MRESKFNFNVLALLILGISIFCIIGGLLFGAKTSFYFDGTGFHTERGTTKRYREEKKFSSIRALTIDASFTEVEVKTGDQNKVVVTGMKERAKPSVTIQDNILKIQSSKHQRGFSIGFFQIPDRHTKITIYLTPDTILKNTKIDASFSSVVVKQLVSDRCNIESNFGAIDIQVKAKTVTIDNRFGEVKSTLDNADRIDVASSFGEATLWISKPKTYYQVKTNSSFGDIQTTDRGTRGEADDSKEGNIVLDNHFGDININFTR